MIHLIYGSSTAYPMTDDELVEILNKARIKNKTLNITGMLLYKSGNFLQVLEGEEDVVMPLFRTIEKDPRHHNVQLIAKRAMKERAFPEWEMGFAKVDSLKPIDVPGFSEFLTDELDSERFREPVFAYMFLQAFKEGMR